MWNINRSAALKTECTNLLQS